MELRCLPCSWISASIPDTSNMLLADEKLVSQLGHRANFCVYSVSFEFIGTEMEDVMTCLFVFSHLY